MSAATAGSRLVCRLALGPWLLNWRARCHHIDPDVCLGDPGADCKQHLGLNVRLGVDPVRYSYPTPEMFNDLRHGHPGLLIYLVGCPTWAPAYNGVQCCSPGSARLTLPGLAAHSSASPLLLQLSRL